MKDKILDLAAEKIRMYGLKKFTIDDIAKELKISKKTIYKYYNSKDAIIEEFFDFVIKSDKESVEAVLNDKVNFHEKINNIIYSNHKYKLPIKILKDMEIFYPEAFKKLNLLKDFKVKAVNNLLKEEIKNGHIRENINFPILCKIFEEISNTFLDYNFLLSNKLTSHEAIEEVIKIIFHGIEK
ncbi:TetR/AcrR family transcriptional regulator [Clostridium felsineum]|uniref:Uncharacterized protein n=1 Tax=Clostridium felsineum TaxID=36839 RepID=A0A1S8KYV9_9CLOT|nr:TetR/AcrR family transcriptional regulator [Clostridium felsineum]MCR3760871.1 TetR/AcrR family transcriptional regulator [Clostridium felsineum]URZ07756.1 hypothetical protein CLROS_031170 [Clostridium felsineum]URZ12787.1 hypothetical protein CROST_035320 [Clostridium felsineum]